MTQAKTLILLLVISLLGAPIVRGGDGPLTALEKEITSLWWKASNPPWSPWRRFAGMALGGSGSGQALSGPRMERWSRPPA